MRRRFALGAVLAALVAVIALSMVTRGPPEPETAPADALLEAWLRSREATYLVEYTFERTTARGGQLKGLSTVAQRPPDRLAHSLAGADGLIDGIPVACVTAPGADQRCVRGDPGESYAREVTSQLETLEEYLLGVSPLYDVRRDGAGCFELGITRPLLAPPYGTAARFCFDADTGAPSLIRISQPEGTDLTTAVEISTTVTDADLQVPVS